MAHAVDCLSCNYQKYCCDGYFTRSFQILMDAKEAEIFGMEHVKSHPEIKGWYVYDNGPSPGPCPHLKRGLCDIQSIKPRWCRHLPITVRRTKDGGFDTYCMERCLAHLTKDRDVLRHIVDQIRSVPEIAQQSHEASYIQAVRIDTDNG